MGIAVLAGVAVAVLAAILLAAPMMYTAAALTRAALSPRNGQYSTVRLTLLPAIAEWFVATSFTASVTGAVRALLEAYGGPGGAWLWAAGFLISSLPSAVRWGADFLADPGGTPSSLPRWFEIPVLNAAAFILFAAQPAIVRTVWGWVPFAQGLSHPAWASAAIICLAAAALKASQAWLRRRRPFFMPASGCGTPRSFAAGSGR